METRFHEHCDCLVARPMTRSLDYSVCGEFRDLVMHRLKQHATSRLVIDLQNVTFLDSLSIGALVSLHRQGKEQGGRVALCGLTPFVANVLQMVTVDDLFEVFADVPRAVDSLCRANGLQPASGGSFPGAH